MGTLRDQILAAEDLPREQVDTAEWAPFGVPFVLVQGLSAKERDEWELSMTGNGSRKMKNIRANFVARVLVDENGERVFNDDKGIQQLAEKSALVLERLSLVGLRLSGMTPDGEEEPNPSKGDQDELSSSGSPLPSGSLTQTI